MVKTEIMSLVMALEELEKTGKVFGRRVFNYV